MLFTVSHFVKEGGEGDNSPIKMGHVEGIREYKKSL